MPKGGGPAGAVASALVAVGVVGAIGYNSVFTGKVDANTLLQFTAKHAQHRSLQLRPMHADCSAYIVAAGYEFHSITQCIEWPTIYDVRTRPRNLQSLTGSKDLQMVNITLRVLSKPDSTKLPFIYRRLGLDFDERVLPSIVNEVTKAVVAKYNAAELLTKREQVSKAIHDALLMRAKDFAIELDDVAITHLSFSREYTAAVEAKQVAQQDSERAKYVVMKAVQEKAIRGTSSRLFYFTVVYSSALQRNHAVVSCNRPLAMSFCHLMLFSLAAALTIATHHYLYSVVTSSALPPQMSIVLKAKGEAESAGLIGKAIKDNPGFLQLRRIDAARDIAATVSKGGNRLYLDTDSLMLNVAAGDGQLMPVKGKR
eukprot:2114-Heterococcus_DN1.PRE.4